MTLSSNRSTRRFAVPGPIWGDYPQVDDPRERIVRRQTGVIATQTVARQARNFKKVCPQRVRKAIADAGICSESCAMGLQLVSEIIQSKLGMKPRPCQYEAAACLLNQQLVEMDTGEGKSLAIAMAAAVAAMGGAPVHVMTTNDYLAKRDADKFRTVFESLGLSVAAIDASEHAASKRRSCYQADICYGTAKTMAFDYLRDQRQIANGPHSLFNPPDTVMRGLCLAIVDEADSIFLDEATMPLVLAEQIDDPSHRSRLWQAVNLTGQLRSDVDYTVDEKRKRVSLTTLGLARISDLGDGYSAEWLNSHYRTQLIVEALSARHLYKIDRDYIIRDDKILVVDRNTGRAVAGRHFPGHLHGLIAIVHNLSPAPVTRAASGLTYPRFFARYHHLSGMSGTLLESTSELMNLYGLAVRRISRHKKNQITHLPLRISQTRHQQFEQVVRRAITLAKHSRPVLIGTDSVAESEKLANQFARAGASVTLLNASNDQQESHMIRRAGKAGQITISTQIAGRGTDIIPDSTALKAGGLHVLNMQHNRSARIDRQLSGRTARQGSPGSAEHWIRLEGSAYSSENLPGPVDSAFRTLCAIKLPHIAQKLVRVFWETEDRLARSTRLRADRELSNRLHFSSMGNH